MDLSAICRTCIKTYNSGLNPIFLSEDTHDKISSTFYSCTGVQVKFNDGLPQNMCTTCMNQFNNTLKFRKQCKQAEMQLLNIKPELQKNQIPNPNPNPPKPTKTTNTQLHISITERKIKKNQPTTINKSDLQDCRNAKRIKTESNGITTENIKTECNSITIKNEPVDMNIKSQIDEHKIVTPKSKSFELLNNECCNAEDTSDTEPFNKQTNSYKNDFKTETVSVQNPEETFKIYLKCNYTEETLTDDEYCNISNALETSDSNSIEEINTEVPYVISDTNAKKTTRVVCKLCQKELSIRSIDSHMMRRHPGADKRKVKCELCDKYLMREKLNRHRVMMHGNVGVRCGYCKSEFKSQEALVDHVATCTAKSKRRKINDSGRVLAECDICKMTMQRASLIKHKAVKHAGLRPVCEHCGKCFGNKFRLNEHYRAKHGYEKFQCSYSYCDFRSAGIMAMRNHERRHRGEKPFICETCGAKFHAAYILMQHKHSHRTEKLVKCDLCPASFKANNNLHMHKLTCHSKAYYGCTLCARTYKCRHYAVKHARLAHHGSEASDVIKLMTQ